MKIHDLKITREYFDEVISGNKTFEIRKNDREFMRGDVLLLREIDSGYDGIHGRLYTERMKAVRVTYITDYEQKSRYVVMGISLI